MSVAEYQGRGRPGSFNPFLGLLVVAILLSAVSFSADWYAEKVLMPRYCENIPETMKLLEEVLTEERPAGSGSRVPYLVAARMTHLRPRQGSETIPAYLERLQLHLQDRCR